MGEALGFTLIALFGVWAIGAVIAFAWRRSDRESKARAAVVARCYRDAMWRVCVREEPDGTVIYTARVAVLPDGTEQFMERGPEVLVRFDEPDVGDRLEQVRFNAENRCAFLNSVKV